MSDGLARLIALHLPQFYPIPENDEWWGKGFTEWRNTAKAKPLFKGHYQPHLPADLGFYDLRVAESRAAQAALARAYGIEAFCYYHYWFAGRRVLDRPVREIVQSGEPNFPFCVCWANETWTGIWHGSPNRVLIEQTYPGEQDHRHHFEELLPAFRDERYVRVDGRPLFAIHQPMQIPNVVETLAFWRKLAVEAGLGGLYLVGARTGAPWDRRDIGLDASYSWRMPDRRPWVSKRKPFEWLRRRREVTARRPTIYRYEDVLNDFWPQNQPDSEDYPLLIPNWDNSPRSGANGLVLHDSTPELFRRHIRRVKEQMAERKSTQNLIFIKSWNEWAEGNHLEPDLKFGHGYLQVLREEFAAR
ncbi:MAG: glycoside hydrolase family 99-like domain-containing protein [Gemmatimonadaceae bacterium]